MADWESELESKNGPCSIHILHQYGPICREVYGVTLTLYNLANKCWNDAASSKFYSEKFAGKKSVDGSGKSQGGALHERLYDLAREAQRQGKLPVNLRITRVTTRAIDEADKVRHEWWNSSKGPDFVLNGKIGSEDVVAAWELTTAKGLVSHYDRDVAGKSKAPKGSKKEPKPPFDQEAQQPVDTMYPWTSYIAISY